MVCGAKLEYFTNETELKCYYCGNQYEGYVNCPNRHAICEKCHNRPAIEITKSICDAANTINPISIFNSILDSKNITMLGCHHAFMVAGALITAINNAGKINLTEEQRDELFSRISNQAISGYCGLTGLCGIAPAVGACFSLILGAKCGSDNEQRFVMDIVAEICKEIANLTGPSCCKAYSWSAIEVGARAANDVLNIKLELDKNKIDCIYSKNHPHGCRHEKCPYFNGR